MPPKEENKITEWIITDSMTISTESGVSDAQKVMKGNEQLTEQFRDRFLEIAREYNKQKHENDIWFDLAALPYKMVPYNPTWGYGTCNCGFDINLRRKYDDWYRKKEKEMAEQKYAMDKLRPARVPAIDHVISNGNATIVFWNDGKKTVVKRSEGECDDREKAILTAFAIKTLGGKPELNKMMRKAFKDKEPKRYHWTDICKIRFYKPDPMGKAFPDKKLMAFMDDIKKSFEQFGHLSVSRLCLFVTKNDIFSNGGKGFEMCKFDEKNIDSRLVWANPKDFGIAKEYDREKKRWYDHIYIRRSPEPKPYPDDGKGEGK